MTQLQVGENIMFFNFAGQALVSITVAHVAYNHLLQIKCLKGTIVAWIW